MVPLELLTLKAHHGNDGEHADGDDFLNDFELHEVEGTSCNVRSDGVGRNEEAVFYSCHEPRQKNHFGH